jgi:tellurite resistance protein
MPKSNLDNQEMESEVQSEIEQAKEFAKQIDFNEVQSGEWFIKLLRQVLSSYQQNVRAEYFQQKYPGLTPDEIADILISVTVRYAAIAGAITGIAVSASQIALIGSAGMTAALFITSIGAEMVYLARIQIRLVLDLATAYDVQLDPNDPEDILMIFGYALGITPTEFVGKGVQIAASETSKRAIKTYISKGTLKAIQDFARRLGFRILQRTIIKYIVPAVSAAVGSGYNYTTTMSVGKIAKSNLKNRGKVTDELRALVSKQRTYDLIYPAAVMYVAKVDGEFHERERELYKAMLSRMTFDEYQQKDFQDLINHEDDLLTAIGKIEDKYAAETFMELLILMAIYDGKIVEAERMFLEKVAETLQVDLDTQALEQRMQEYQVDYSDKHWQKITETMGEALVSAKNTSVQIFQASKEKTQAGFQKLFSRNVDTSSDTE